MKKISLLILLLMPFLVQSADIQTVTGGCRFAWTWEGDGAQLDGFRMYIDGSSVGEVGRLKRRFDCPADLNPGVHKAHVTAFNAAGESGPSEEIIFMLVQSPPGAPANFKLVVTFK